MDLQRLQAGILEVCAGPSGLLTPECDVNQGPFIRTDDS